MSAPNSILDTRASSQEISSPVAQFMVIAVRLAGLFHDLGKGTIGFARKLEKAVSKTLDVADIPDPIRHEVISTMLIDVPDPDAFLRRLSDPDAIGLAFKARSEWLRSPMHVAHVKEALQTCYSISGSEHGSANLAELDFFARNLSLNDQQKWRNSPFWMSVLWLVFTHHKLPSGAWSDDKKRYVSELSRHVGPLAYENQPLEIDTMLERVEYFLDMPENDQPWSNADWVAEVNICAKELLRLREAYPDFEQSFLSCTDQSDPFEAITPWMASLTRVGRFSLVLGDYEASCDENKPVFLGAAKGKLFANTKFVNSVSHYGDRLHAHLVRASVYGCQVIKTMFALSAVPLVSPARLVTDKIPKRLHVPTEIAESAFAWQGHAQQAISGYQDTQKGFFCVVAAGTGRGKTKACAALMSNSRKSPRFSVLLSMRSLTFQTASAYLGPQIGFGTDQVAMFVGDDVLKKRFRALQKCQHTVNFTGSDNNPIGDRDHAPSILFKGTVQATSQFNCVRNDYYLMGMLGAPVTVMTVDHLIRLIDLSSSKDLMQTLHLMHTDIILDEVDDYKGYDLLCIGRLIELAGQFGRRVIIASATLPQTVVEGFRQAYYSGYSVYQQTHGAENADSLIVTHLPPYLSRHESGSFGEFYAKTMGAFVSSEEALARKHPRRVVTNTQKRIAHYDSARLSRKLPPLALVPASQYENKTKRKRDPRNAQLAFNQAVLQTCLDAHHNNRLQDPATGLSYSAGFIRLNTVKAAQAFARELERSAYLEKLYATKGIRFKIICYHAQNLGAVRVEQERFLERHLNRTCMNDGASDPLLDSQAVRETLETLKTEQAKDLVFLVITSSIMETGRDFDFDWCVLEPSATTSIVQAGGRVRRHRHQSVNSPNVFVMPLSLMAMTNEGKAWQHLSRTPCSPRAVPLYSHKRALTHLGICPRVTLDSNPVTTDTAFSQELIGMSPLHAGHCLSMPKNYGGSPLTAMERVLQLSLFNGKHAIRGQEHLTLEYATGRPDPLLCSAFYEQTRFRGSEVGVRIEYVREPEGWFSYDEKGSVSCINERIEPCFCPGDRPLYLLDQLNIKNTEQLLELSSSLAIDLGYHPLDMEKADATLLSFQRKEFDELCFDPQIGFYDRS